MCSTSIASPTRCVAHMNWWSQLSLSSHCGGLAWFALGVSFWLTLLLAIPAAGFLVRLFMIQHDCGHGAFFRRRSTNDWVGRIIGIFTLTPYDVWRRSHAIHHATTGNLDLRGFGDIHTMTVAEFQASNWRRTTALPAISASVRLACPRTRLPFFATEPLTFGFHECRLEVLVEVPCLRMPVLRCSLPS